MIYIVMPGDTVDAIAARYQVTTDSIIFVNQLEYPYRLAIGQAILIVPEGNVQDMAGKPDIITGGYAYPFISSWVLEQTLPFLVQLFIFSYGFTSEGVLVPPLLSEDYMITMAQEYQTLPILTLTPFGTDGKFNNNLIHDLVNSDMVQETLINNLLEVMQQKGYGGLDIDFEYILPEDKDRFSAFVEKISERMRSQGYQISIALAPKTSADQPGLLYEGKDYKRLGEAVDQVLLMTYEWGYTYGPPMAVAPIHKVREVVEYALTEIPAEKILLGIPNYGYDWKLPYERGVSRARTIGNVEAVQIAIEQEAAIEFDMQAQSPYFTYQEWNGEREVFHEVWFEDVRSIQAKFDLIEEFNLRGAGYWQIMQLFRANWILLKENF